MVISTPVNWVIFGASHIILDILDAIVCNRENLLEIVVNMPISEKLIGDLKQYKITKIEDYSPRYCEQHIFGFTDVNKEDFLKQIPDKLFWRNLVHPKAHCSSYAKLDKGNFIGANSTLAPRVCLEAHNFVNRNASIGHHTEIGSFNHFGPGSTVCGMCNIGSKNFFGAGSIIKDKITIGDNITIGAGSVVTKDTLNPGVYVGMPARKVG